MDPVALWQQAATLGLYLSAVAMRGLQLASYPHLPLRWWVFSHL